MSSFRSQHHRIDETHSSPFEPPDADKLGIMASLYRAAADHIGNMAYHGMLPKQFVVEQRMVWDGWEEDRWLTRLIWEVKPAP